jgi:membrane complex biogenesis BtpA family protein
MNASGGRQMSDRERVDTLFGGAPALIGMLHLAALPGSPGARLSLEAIAEAATAEALIYHDAGFSGLMIENMHDRPYLKRAAGPETVAAMARIGSEVRRLVSLPLGVQVLAGANREAIAVAHACGGSFVRVEGFVFAHLADEGLIEADAGALLRYRRSIGAEAVRVFADVKKKHASHALSADVDVVETARAAEFFLADGVIVTGTATGRATDAAEVAAVHDAVGIPVWVGSGVTPENLGGFHGADGFIVGSSVKQDGVWSNPLDRSRVAAVASAFRRWTKERSG